jgi:4-hydroxybenzoyl-CoA reductase subunit beta
MLRLPTFELRQPTSLADAMAILNDCGSRAMVLAGGTDLLPNLKHELFAPEVVVSLGRIPGLRGVRRGSDGSLIIGAMTTIADVASNDLLRAQAPCLAQAASLISGPQLRQAGTIGGNILLDTRCQYYNQSYFWRSALGFCLKKDGTTCHVVAGGRKCVAAAAADSAPALMTLDATLEIESRHGRRRVAIDDFWVHDGTLNRRLDPGEILVAVHIPATLPGHHGAYGKLRERGSIDFPLIGVAVRLDAGPADRIQRADVVLTALEPCPRRIPTAHERLRGEQLGTPSFDRAVDDVADAAYHHCHVSPNMPGDEVWRKEMIPVYVRRTLRAAAAGQGPVAGKKAA